MFKERNSSQYLFAIILIAVKDLQNDQFGEVSKAFSDGSFLEQFCESVQCEDLGLNISVVGFQGQVAQKNPQNRPKIRNKNFVQQTLKANLQLNMIYLC